MRCEAGVLVWRVVGVSVGAAKWGCKSIYCVRVTLVGLEYGSTYGPSDHVKMWLKPQEATSFSADARDWGMVFLGGFW
jgi:hypothetical protein